MPDVNLLVNSAVDDARSAAGGGTYDDTVTTHLIGATDIYYTNGFVFDNVAIPQGATINSATFDLYARGAYSSGTTVYVDVHCEDADNAAEFSIGSTPGDRTLTTAKDTVVVDTASWTTDGYGLFNADVTTAVQEVVNRAGFSSGNSIGVILFIDQVQTPTYSYVGARSYDYNTSTVAKLDITYTEAAVTYTVTKQVILT